MTRNTEMTAICLDFAVFAGIWLAFTDEILVGLWGFYALFMALLLEGTPERVG